MMWTDFIDVMNFIFIIQGVVKGPKNFRRSKGSNAHEDSSESHRAGRDRHVGFFWYSRKIKSTLNPTTNYGEGSRRKHGI